ncbi:hypothetical protein E0Z10_g2191 [Xylaria hypoxylon]|uniref:Uncharacterized protein n=1 Tax=Xylaria hypoxylon TaxID=37992 RepID=A0A4Z0ZD15_9PEZI|nr:hypothetical protein E0Z10_g2191 [Xylaria hypoxylon]
MSDGSLRDVSRADPTKSRAPWLVDVSTSVSLPVHILSAVRSRFVWISLENSTTRMSPSDARVVEYGPSDPVVEVLRGGVSTRLLHHPDRSFAFEVTLDLVRGAEFFRQKPPVHFHLQEEYIEATQGRVGLEVEGREVVLTPGPDARFDIPPYMNHRSYPLLLDRQEDGNTVVKFLLSGGSKTDSPAASNLHPIFFENWYKYQDDVVVYGASIDLIQVFCMFDAGGTYLSLPWWVPFGQTVSIALGVVLGRWIGSGLLGYQPFYRKWTSDWELAFVGKRAKRGMGNVRHDFLERQELPVGLLPVPDRRVRDHARADGR